MLSELTDNSQIVNYITGKGAYAVVDRACSSDCHVDPGTYYFFSWQRITSCSTTVLRSRTLQRKTFPVSSVALITDMGLYSFQTCKWFASPILDEYITDILFRVEKPRFPICKQCD